MKTIDASKKALKSAEKKTMESLKDIEIVKQISKARKTLWFEKFIWFISSENYLVIAGRDAQQNELIVKKHLRQGDVYVHADIHGASSCVIKNQNPEEPISPVTLLEVGHAAVCYSAAWDAKVVTSAWWVHSNQVSKTAPSGEYLTTGSFMIRGKKNYLPPSHLIMGVGFLFRLDETSVGNHKNERRIKGTANLLQEAENETEASENMVVDDDDNNSEDEDPFKTDIKIDYTSGKAPDLPTEEVIYMGDNKPIVVKYSDKKQNENDQKANQKQKKERAKPAWKIEKEEKASQQKQKRGKAGKMKKIKDKYGDQDEEDRQAAMDLLHGAQSERKGKRKQKKPTQESKNQRGQKQKAKEKEGNVFQRAAEELAPPETMNPDEESLGNKKKSSDESEKMNKTKNTEESRGDDDGDSDEDEVNKMLEEEGFGDSTDLLGSLTGKPTAEDILHYAIPVIAPFNAVRDYKYHIKMTPGTGKKGKTAKQAIQIFCARKDSIEKETQLMKASKEEEITRNMPGKVKLSASNINQLKGKKK